jgi:serine/threonine protein kinase
VTPNRLIADRDEVHGILGRGGMGEVFLAYDHRLATEVALKHVPLELSLEPGMRNALVREAQILARLSDTNIVRLFDLADTPDGMFLVLEYVCGPSLDKVLLQRKTLSPEELLHIIDHVCPGIARAHSMGVIHRDLKPSNLLVSLSGDERRYFVRDKTLPANLLHTEVKVTDFGLAKLVLNSRAEASGLISGTPAFMAPEQFRGELPSVETDIYALGYVAYVCLAGKVPAGNAELMYFHLMVTPPPLPGIPGHMNTAILKAVSKERKDRFQSALEFAEALRGPAAQAPPPEVRTKTYVPRVPPPPPPPLPENRVHPGARKKNSRTWLIVSAGLAIVTLLFVIAALLTRNSIADGAAGTAPESGSLAEPGALPPPLPLNPAARIDEPPPVIEAARLTGLPSPRPPVVAHPELLAVLRVLGRQVLGFGPDGTLYLTGNRSDIGAVRNGQLLWQFRLAGDMNKFTIAPDGLLWIHYSIGEPRLFCFNAAGQGGELVNPGVKARYLAYVIKLETPPPAVECGGAGGSNNGPVVKPWRTPIDHECEQDPVIGRNGNVLIQTQSRSMYLLSGAGAILWTYSAPCLLQRSPLLLSNGTAVGLCSSPKSVIGIADGRERFSLPAGAGISGPLAEAQDNTFYRFLDTEIYDKHYLALTDSNGKDRWTFGLRVSIRPELVVAPDGKICLLNMSPGGSFLMIVGDRSR